MIEQAMELTRSTERASYGANPQYRESKLWSKPEVQREQAMELTHSTE